MSNAFYTGGKQWHAVKRQHWNNNRMSFRKMLNHLTKITERAKQTVQQYQWPALAFLYVSELLIFLELIVHTWCQEIDLCGECKEFK